jgi:biotin transport system substrate-specific component
MTTAALVPSLFLSQRNTTYRSALIVALGVVALAALAQVSVRVPFSVVPITGQTFGVTLLALMFGRRLGIATVLAYLGLGATGLPVFALGDSGLGGPTTGYLVGMVASSWVVGKLADRGFARSFAKAWVAGFAGDCLTFAIGLSWLSFFVPREGLWMVGLIPFIPGELIKNTLAASIASTSDKIR